MFFSMFIRYHLWWIEMYNVREQFSTPVGTGKRQVRDSNLSLMTALAAASEWHMPDMTNYSSSLKQFTRRRCVPVAINRISSRSSIMGGAEPRATATVTRRHVCRESDGWLDTHDCFTVLQHHLRAGQAWDWQLRPAPLPRRPVAWRLATQHRTRKILTVYIRLRSVTDVQDIFQKVGLSWRYTIEQYLEGSLLKNFIAL